MQCNNMILKYSKTLKKKGNNVMEIKPRISKYLHVLKHISIVSCKHSDRSHLNPDFLAVQICTSSVFPILINLSGDIHQNAKVLLDKCLTTCSKNVLLGQGCKNIRNLDLSNMYTIIVSKFVFLLIVIFMIHLS